MHAGPGAAALAGMFDALGVTRDEALAKLDREAQRWSDERDAMRLTILPCARLRCPRTAHVGAAHAPARRQ